MAYKGKDVKIAYDQYSKIVPVDDPQFIFLNEFKKVFGEDGNIFVIGIKDSSLFKLKNFLQYLKLGNEIARINGINEVLSLPRLQLLVKDEEKKQFILTPLFDNTLNSQQTLDSLLTLSRNIKFYEGQLFNKESSATLLLVYIDQGVLNSVKRRVIIKEIKALTDKFSTTANIKLYYSGLPYIRTITVTKVTSEIRFFILLAIIVTGLILLLFYRSLYALIFPLIVIGTAATWSVGIMVLLNYKITMLLALIPPIIIIIGIPNCIYLMNKYHQEYKKHSNQAKALSKVLRKIGLATLITNATTAVGFVVLLFTNIPLLKEFGIVASLSTLSVFIVSIILIPTIFSYLPPPNTRQLKHLDFILLSKLLHWLDSIAIKYRPAIYSLASIIVIISIIGIMKIRTIAHMVDDLPKTSNIQTDLIFFEKNFTGVMPLEFVINTGKKKGTSNLSTLRKVEKFENFLKEQPGIAVPVSLVSFVKAAKQAYYNGHPDFYQLPSNQDKNIISRYMRSPPNSPPESEKRGIGETERKKTKQFTDSPIHPFTDSVRSSGEGDLGGAGRMAMFVDSTGQTMRISTRVADIGSQKMDFLVDSVIKPKIKELFGDGNFDIEITGTTLLFLSGNKYLVRNLKYSLLLALLLIGCIMAVLFGNFRTILISIIPNVIPLLITGGLMGYFGIPLKPSTAIIFSIAFGISVDDSIHYLAKYRQELFSNNFRVPLAVSISLKETGTSMIYTSLVLLAGFVIFAGSDFGGTIALGVLITITLFFAMLTNLTVLPSLLLTFDQGRRKKDIQEEYKGFYSEDEDEEIDVKQLGHL
ncbi:MAG: MMPL family transporter [Cytophagales bacterium]|nr:MMPL family transporter [Cytophagales bacterium]